METLTKFALKLVFHPNYCHTHAPTDLPECPGSGAHEGGAEADSSPQLCSVTPPEAGDAFRYLLNL